VVLVNKLLRHYTMAALPTGYGLRYNKRTRKRTKWAILVVRRAAMAPLMPSV